MHDFAGSLEEVTALRYSLATTFPRRIYAQGERAGGGWGGMRWVVRGALNAHPRQTPALRSAWKIMGWMARGGAAARSLPLTPDTALLRRPFLCPSLHPHLDAAAADSLQQSLQELDLVPQAVLLMQPEED